MTLLSIMAGVFIRYFDEGNRLFQQVDAQKELLQEGRMVLWRVVREVRQVRSGQDVLVADMENLSFYAMGDSLIAINFAAPPAGDLTLTRGALTYSLAGSVDSLAFEYFRDDGSPAVPTVSPSSTDIHRVDIFLRLSRGPKSVSLKTGTFLRNI